MKSLSVFTRSLISLQKSLRPFFSSSFPVKSFTDRRDGAIEDCPAYLRSMLRRPPTVKRWNLPRDSCSFIGTVIRPVKRYAGDNSRSRAYTVLEVKTPSRDSDPSSSSSSFKILLEMRDQLSEISLGHLKPNDYIYVCGTLSSYEKVDASGKRNFYKVFVTDLNFVKHTDTNKISQKLESASADPTAGTSCEFDQEKSPSVKKKGTGPVCGYGRCSLLVLMNGGITGKGREIQGGQILNIRIPRNLCGLLQMTPHG